MKYERHQYIYTQHKYEQYAMLSYVYHKIEAHIYSGAANGTYKSMHHKPAFSSVMKFAIERMGAKMEKVEDIWYIEFPANHSILNK